jgi:NADH:ubiquinone reductase (H+-translocating)
VLMAEATRIDLERKKVELLSGEISYDYLVIATGATHSYFGHPEWSRFAPGLKSIEDALEIRRRILFAYEAAERESDDAARQAWLTFVVVGGGPTGVELAGALAEISRSCPANEYRRISPAEGRIVLVDGAARILSSYPQELSDEARRALERLGVEVRTGTLVTEVTDSGARAGSEFLPARTVLWCAGVAASPLASTLGIPVDKTGHVSTTQALTVPGHDEVFVIGDVARFEEAGKPVPGIAPAAMQQGKHAARNIARAIRGQALQPFRYWDRGEFAVIGRGFAVGVALQRRLKLSGFVAWLAWLTIHISFLIGFRNRMAVLLNWARSFLTLRANAQLITGEDPRALPPLRAMPARSRATPQTSADRADT